MKKILNNIANFKQIRIFMLILCDMLCSAGIFFAVIYLYRLSGYGSYDLSRYRIFLVFVPVFLFFNVLFRTYHGNLFYPGIGLNKIEEIRRVAFSVFLTYLLIFAWLMFFRNGEQYSRLCMFASLILTVPSLPVARFFTRLLMKHLHIGQFRIIIAGAGETGKSVCRELVSSCFYGFKVVGFLDDNPQKKDTVIEGFPVLGTLGAARRMSRKYDVNYVICCLPPESINRTFRHYSKIFHHIMFVPDNRILPISWLYPASIGFWGGFEICNQLLLPIPRVLKRVLEFVLAFFSIIFLLPLFGVLALCVKLSSPGPAFYFANRLGLNGKKIKVLKFRTMYEDADERLEELLEHDPVLNAEWQQSFKLQNDPRVTPVGDILRRTSLDELPQLWNVLRGEMAIIGPRPIVEKEIKYYGESYLVRKRVRPGITGLWQVSGRSEVDYDIRVLLDMYYIMNWSIWMDYYIFFKTVFIVLTRRGAC